MAYLCLVRFLMPPFKRRIAWRVLAVVSPFALCVSIGMDACNHSDANAQCKWRNYGKNAPSCATLKGRHKKSNETEISHGRVPWQIRLQSCGVRAVGFIDWLGLFINERPPLAQRSIQEVRAWRIA